MSNPDRPRNEEPNDRAESDNDKTPGAAGHPEPGSGHDDSETTTVEEGPPIEPVDGEPGASGDVEIDRKYVTRSAED